MSGPVRTFGKENMTVDLMKLPLGTSGFAGLRTADQIYIDKTDMIFQMARTRGKYFLSRPRRFGKSLLVSTFETLFRDGLEYFDGLKIAEKWKDTTYGVVTLDFSNLKDKRSIETMSARFDETLQNAFGKAGFVYKNDDRRSCLGQVEAWLGGQAPGSLVLLVDEYDAPLNSHLDNPEFFNQIRDMLSGFFSLVKSLDNVWRFIFITGIAKFNKASIFSAFNNLEDISLDSAYGTLLGYTETEILDNFKPFVENAAQVSGMEVPALMEAMRTKYDGFCFDGKAASHVYAPWSVLSFFKKPEEGLQDFWYGSAGKASVVTNYLNLHPLSKNVEDFGEDIPVALNKLRDSNDVETLPPAVFLFQAGYLTIKRASTNTAYLNFPNGEVQYSMNRLMAERMLASRDIDSISIDAWEEAAKKGNLPALVEAMNGTFNQIDYKDYPLTQESHVRAAVQIYLSALGFGVTVEKHYAVGRSDLEFSTGDFYWVLEFKYARKGSKRDKLLEDALEQIKEKHYGEGLNIGNKTLLRVGLVFDGKARKFVKYGTV